MVLSVRGLIELWPVAVLAVAAPAVPIALHVAEPSFSLARQGHGYPFRLYLPPQPSLAAREEDAATARPAVEFDTAGLAPADIPGSAVEIRKAVRIDDVDAGSATIRVNARSELSISADELRRLLLDAGRGDLARLMGARTPADGFVGFDELRGLGISLRYDVSSDRITIAA